MKKCSLHGGIPKKAFAVIPARGGSVRVPRKNMADFGGKPAVAHVIQIAKDCNAFERVAVSTDDKEIADYALSSGAEVIQRPPNLADGFTPLQPVVAHAIQQMPEADFICLILATAIFLRPESLRLAHSMLIEDSNLDYAIGVRRFDSPPQRGILLDEAGFVSMKSPEFINSRSQDLKPLYHDAGQFSFGRRIAWLSSRPSFMARTRGIELLRSEAIDIDEPEDLVFARLLFDAKNKC